MAVNGYAKDYRAWDQWVFDMFGKQIAELGPRAEANVEVYRSQDGAWKAVHSDGSRLRVLDLATGIEEFGKDLYAEKHDYVSIGAYVPTFYAQSYGVEGVDFFAIKEASQASRPEDIQPDSVFSLPYMFNGWTRQSDPDYVRVDVVELGARGEPLSMAPIQGCIELPSDMRSVRDFVRFETTRDYYTGEVKFAFKVLSESFYDSRATGACFGIARSPAGMILKTSKS